MRDPESDQAVHAASLFSPCYHHGMEYKEANSRAWDWEAEHGSAWAVIASPEMIEKARSGHPEFTITVNRKVPESWLLPLKGGHVLSLGGGGGQQTPILAAFGCDVESADISRVMIERDREALRRYSLEGKPHVMDMQDLSAFSESSFDGVIDNASIAGGICGVSMSDSLVIACSSSGTIAGDDAAGGIIGTNRNTVGYNPVETVDSDVMVLVSNTDAELSGTKKGNRLWLF